ncbi:OmpA family protein [Hyphomicrobium sp. xq]|uniref:OmpA family protein n=1 Tax=Hyphomicrobium album TaxID=2665159 RepID=A0A6I3KHW3_9HYPH|nr:OmpA family protein [Hyphomicrobium album]MTD93706.1 OmpA family protein [Hyphomicrobium album]
MRCHPARWLWGLIPIAMLSWLAVNAESDRIERDLEQRSAAALAAAGHDWASVAFSGRDGLLVGTPDRPGQRDEAVGVVSDVWGVRVVEVRDRAAVDPAPPSAVPAHEEIPRQPLRDLAPVDLPVASSDRAVAARVAAGPLVSADEPGGVVQAHAPPDVLVGARDERIAEALPTQSEPSDVVQAREATPADSVESRADIAPAPAASLIEPAEKQAGPPATTVQKEVAEAPSTTPVQPQEAISIPAADRATDPGLVAKIDDVPPPPERKEFTERQPTTPAQPQEALSIPAADPARDPAVVAKVDDIPPPPERKEVTEAPSAGPAQPQEALSIPAADPARDPAVVAKVEAPPSSEGPAVAPVLPVPKQEAPGQPPPLPAPKADGAAKGAPPIPQAKADPVQPATAPAADAQPKPSAPDHRFDTAALPPGNIASQTGCTSNVQTAARQVEVHFARGRAHLDHAGKTAVDRLVGALNACPGTALSIAGHADAAGQARRNLALSKHRARGVTAYLVEKGIDASRLAAVGYGETRPVAPNNSRANRAKNRRIEVVITAHRVPPPPMPVRKQDADNGLSRR